MSAGPPADMVVLSHWARPHVYGVLDMVERRIELDRRYHRKEKMRKLKA